MRRVMSFAMAGLAQPEDEQGLSVVHMMATYTSSARACRAFDRFH
jgi:hypothetical protein